MSFQVSGTYDGSQELAQRIRQQRADTQLDPQVVALANKNKQEVLSKRAGFAAMQRLQQEYADKGVGVGGAMDADGNIQWNYNDNIFSKLKAAGKDLSQAPKNEYAGRMQMGDAQLNQYATQNPENGKMVNIESGNANEVVDAQQQINQNAMRSQGLPQQAPLQEKQFHNQQQLQQQTAVPPKPQGQANAQSIIFGNQASTQSVSSQPPSGQISQDLAQSRLPDKKVSVGEDYRRSIAQSSSDSFSGSTQPLSTELNFRQAGYEDPGEAQAAMRLRNAMYGIQGDVQRGIGITEGTTGEERRGQQDVEMLNKRYDDYNKTVMQPDLKGSMQGGTISQSSSANQSINQTIDQSRKETAASGAAAAAAAERNDINFLSGNKVTLDGNGRNVFGTTAKAGDLEGTRFFEDAVQGKIRGVKFNQQTKEIEFEPGADLKRYANEIRGRIGNKGATGTSDNTLPAATLRAKGMRDLSAVQGQQRQVGNPMDGTAPNYNQVFDANREDSLVNAAKRIKSKIKK
jgi:hypothetical protein